MSTNFKHIHIGNLLKERVEECNIELERAATFIGVTEKEIEEMYLEESLEVDILLRWSKLLEYDFFRLFTQHLILYSPQDRKARKRLKTINENSSLPKFKKNIYTKEVIEYLIELVESGEKTYKDLQAEYNIPITTILRWGNKYGTKKEITDGNG